MLDDCGGRFVNPAAMSLQPLVSVITPTWQRRELLSDRALPSVRRQSYPAVEHVVVIDGPDSELETSLADQPGVRVLTLPVHDPQARWGHLARLAGISASRGDMIAYLDDDDEWDADHLDNLILSLAQNTGADFAYPRMRAHMTGGSVVRIGDGPLARGRIATSMILHRRELLKIATWQDVPEAPDWNLVQRWLDAGVNYASVDAETVDYWPAQPIDPAEKVYVSYIPHYLITEGTHMSNAGKERQGHAEHVRSEAEDQVQAEAAEQRAAALAGVAAEATRVRELAQDEQMEAAKRRAERRLAEREQEAAEQQRVDAAREAEANARKNADEAARGVKKAPPAEH